MSRADRFEFTLDEDTEKRLYELLTSMDTRNTDRFWIKDKRGYNAEYVKVIRCSECRFYNKETLHCDTNTGKWFVTDYCSYAERKEE